MSNINTPLSPEDFKALKEVSKGQMQGHISEASKHRLLRLRLIETVLGGLKLTANGQMRLLMKT